MFVVRALARQSNPGRPGSERSARDSSLEDTFRQGSPRPFVYPVVLIPLFLSLLLLLGGCASPPAPATRTGANRPDVSEHGYALLFDLLGDEKDVSKLLIIKRERAELRGLIQEISRRCARAHEELEAFAKADRRLNLKELGLPASEVKARKSISKARGKQLLTGHGKDFELHLLLTQEEALTYAIHLADVTGAHETDPGRVQFLRTLAGDLRRLEEQLMAMLLANYSLPAPK